jgi:hypothetical protein
METNTTTPLLKQTTNVEEVGGSIDVDSIMPMLEVV